MLTVTNKLSIFMKKKRAVRKKLYTKLIKLLFSVVMQWICVFFTVFSDYAVYGLDVVQRLV